MFLSTLLSDAAASHGHEFSSPRPQTPSPARPPRLSPLPRTIRPTSASKQRPPLATLPKSAVKPVSAPSVARVEKVMFADEAEIKIVSPPEPRRSISSSSEEDEAPVRSMADAVKGKTDELVLKDKVKVKGRRLPRSRTTYNLCHPPPRGSKTLSKLKSRPTAVLQLQHVTSGQRAKPAFEILPSGRYAAKLGRHLARLHKGKDRLGTEDVVVVKAQEYDLTDSVEDLTPQQVVGIICASCKHEGHASGNAQLCLEDGSTWEAIPHGKGRFDFVSTDELGMSRLVRWVPRKVRAKQRPLSGAGTPTGPPSPIEETVYRFSTIDSRSRRHPVIATMTPSNLEINDIYYMPKAVSTAAEEDDDAEESSPQKDADRKAITTSSLLRSLILLSGIYVGLRNGWTPAFSYKPASTSCKPCNSQEPSRSNSIRSANPSPAGSIRTPSVCGGAPLPPLNTRVFSWRNHKKSSSVANGSVCATPTSASGALNSALSGGGWSGTSIVMGEGNIRSTSNSVINGTGTSRSTTPDSRNGPVRRSTMLPRLFRSATDRWSVTAADSPVSSDRERVPSHATLSSGSTAVEAPTPSAQSSFYGAPATPSPIAVQVPQRSATFAFPPTPNSITKVPEPTSAHARRASTGFTLFQKANQHASWHPNSKDTSPAVSVLPSPIEVAAEQDSTAVSDTEEVPKPEPGPSAPRHSRTWSFGRGRSRNRRSTIVEPHQNQPPPSMFNPMWWVDWGRARSRSRSMSRPATATTTATMPAEEAAGRVSVNGSVDMENGILPHPPSDVPAESKSFIAESVVEEERRAWQAEWMVKYGIKPRRRQKSNESDSDTPSPSTPQLRPKSFAGLSPAIVTPTAIATPPPTDPQPKSRRRSMSVSLRPWRRNTEAKERPTSLAVVNGEDLANIGTPTWAGRNGVAGLGETGVDWGQGQKVHEKERGFGGIVRRVTHRLRREERRIG